LVLASVAHSLALAVRTLEAEASANRAEQVAAVLVATVVGADVEQLLAPLAAALSRYVSFSHLRLVLTSPGGERSEYTAVSTGGSGKASGSAPPPSGARPRTLELALEHEGRNIGKLVVLASPEQRLDAGDCALLEALARHLATVVASTPERSELRDSERIRAQLMNSERLASVGQLAAGVAHEVNNPLNVILSNLQLLLERAQQADLDLGAGLGIEDALSESIDGVRRIASAVDHLRDFARGGGERSESADLDLNDVVSTAASIVDGQIRYCARLELELSGLPLVRGDHGKLVQLVTNLLLNAAQSFDEAQQERNRIRVRTRAEPGIARLTVRDNGPGIPSSNLARIFEPFFTTKAEKSATGLGLSVSADIVRRHGGQITVKSREGVGSRFDVMLPAAVSRASSRPASEVRAQFRARILLVDDDAAVLRALGRVLSQNNDVVAVDGGRAAVDLLRQDRLFDAIVCDVMMPDVDGAAVFDAMADIAPELRRRTIFCTGGEFTARAKSFLAGTDNMVLFKPVSVEALTSAIADVLADTQSMLPNTGNSG
jgi:signal transduction histidine kinase/CheY-like chemotaxis protein